MRHWQSFSLKYLWYGYRRSRIMYKIGSFNLMNFSGESGKKRDDEKASKHFAEIIKKEKFDIITLQEIRTPGALASIIKNLGSEYDGIHSTTLKNEVNASCFNPSDEYAFIWEKEKISFVNDPQFYRKLYETVSSSWESYFSFQINEMANNPDSVDEETKKIIPSCIDLHSIEELSKFMRQLIRPPLICAFRPSGFWKNLFWELRIINTHVLFGKCSLTGSRLEELSLIKGKLHTSVNTMRTGDFRSVYTLIAGDYNLNISLANSIGKNASWENHNMLTVQANKTTLKQTDPMMESVKAQSAEDKYYSENYDHFSYDANRVSGIARNVQRIGFENFEVHRNEISDHVPISLEVNI